MKIYEWIQSITAVLMAAFGALVRMLNVKSKRKAKLSRILTEVLGSAFLGTLVLMTGLYYEIHPTVISVFCGCVGLLGIQAPDVVNWIFKRLNIDLKIPDAEEDK